MANNNPTYKSGEDYTKKAPCFIDASNLGDDFDEAVESTPQEPRRNDDTVRNNIQRSTNSLEHAPNLWNESIIPHWPSTNSFENTPNLWNESMQQRRTTNSIENTSYYESMPQSWFVSMSSDTSIENTHREDVKNNAQGNSENKKKGIFDMFVDLNDPKEESSGNLPKTTPHQKHAFKRFPKHNLVDTKNTFGSSSSSGRESGFTENTDSSPSESAAPPQPKYPSLVKLSDLDSDPATTLSPILECTNETSTMPEQKAPKQLYRPLNMTNVFTLMNLFPNLWSSQDIKELCSVYNATNRDSDHLNITNEFTLGDELLKLFDDEVATDLTVDIAGRRVRVHKVVVISRCRYFAGLSRRLVESTGNIVHIIGFSYNTVYLALRYIYTGIADLSKSMDWFELVSFADMLGLESLKDHIGTKIIEKYCHNFHKPCGLCTLSVLDCLPFAMQYDLDEVYQRSLAWLTENFIEIWSTKEFATLPVEALEKVFHKKEVDMTPESIVNLVYGCKQIVYTLPSKRWTETVRNMSGSLLKSAENFSASHLSEVLYSIINTPAAAIHLTDSIIVEWIEKAIEMAPVKELRKACQLLSDHCIGIHRAMYLQSQLQVVEGWRRMCGDTLILNSIHVTVTSDLRSLTPQSLKKERGCVLKEVPTSSSIQVNRMTRTMPAFAPTLSQRIDLSRMYKTFIPYKCRPAFSAEVVHNDKRKTRQDVMQNSSDDRTNKPQSQRRVEAVVVRTTRAQQIRQNYNKESSKVKLTDHSKVPNRPITLAEKPSRKHPEVKGKSSSTSLLSTIGANEFKKLGDISYHRLTSTTVSLAEKSKQKVNYPTVKSCSAVALFRTASGPSKKAFVPVPRKSDLPTKNNLSAAVEKPKDIEQGPSKRLPFPTDVSTKINGSAAVRKPNENESGSSRLESQPSTSTSRSLEIPLQPGSNGITETRKVKTASKIPRLSEGRKKGITAMASPSESSLARAAKVANAATRGKVLPDRRDRSAGGRLAALMLPTASSAAKMVQKKITNSQVNGSSPTPSGNSISPIPRSSTFVKDEPCFPGSPDISQS